MPKTILITGSTDGIGFETAKLLATEGHRLLLHGRNPEKLKTAEREVSIIAGAGIIETYVADMSNLADVADLADQVSDKHDELDAVINNAGRAQDPHPQQPMVGWISASSSTRSHLIF